MSGVKSKVESLCSKFEKDPDSVNLDDEHPNVISNVLKLYLRQVKELYFYWAALFDFWYFFMATCMW